MSVWTEIQTIIKQRISRPSFGKRGEHAAERFLKRKGLKIVERGYRNHIGEIDLVAVDLNKCDSPIGEKSVVFVEVKTRESDIAGHPAEAVDERKQRQIVQTALVFLRQHDLLECRYRFDIVSVIWPTGSSRPQVEHFIDAFQPAGQGQLFS